MSDKTRRQNLQLISQENSKWRKVPMSSHNEIGQAKLKMLKKNHFQSESVENLYQGRVNRTSRTKTIRLREAVPIWKR